MDNVKEWIGLSWLSAEKVGEALQPPFHGESSHEAGVSWSG